jgi:DNA processing protein
VIERAELAAWLRLLETPDVGRESARKLLAAFGAPQAAIAASSAARREVVPARMAHALESPPPSFERQLEATLAWLAESGESARHIITLGDADYPAVLFETADPPVLLYAQGNLAQLRKPSLAVVGSRNPTPAGRETAKAFAASISQAGVSIVSGLALGIDAAAHEGGLSGPGGTVAVVGTGLDRVYPRSHLDLADRIARQGLLLSEFPLGTSPLAGNFPQRNRIIAGLAQGTLVVEAALQSGSLITARLATEAGRDVFAIPGSIHAPQSRGCHALIKQGAKLVDSAQDILDELRWGASVALVEPARAPDDDPDGLLEALGFDPVTLDALVARTGWSASELNIRLLELELAGRVARLPGQLFQRVVQG